jgi:hypothetical protein
MKKVKCCKNCKYLADVINLQMYQKSIVFLTDNPFQPILMKHSSLLGQFESFEDNEML